MPFPGFCLPLSLPTFFIGLTVASGSLGCKDSHPASSLPRHLLPLDLQALLLNLAPALLHSWFTGVAPWNPTSDPVPTLPTTHVWVSVLQGSSVLLQDPWYPVGVLRQLSDLGSVQQISGTGREVAYIISLLFLVPPPACPDILRSTYLFIWLHWVLAAAHVIIGRGVWDLAPWPGMEPKPTALGAWSLSHCTTRDVPPDIFICQLWADKIHSDYVQMCKEKTVVSLLTDDSFEFAHKLPTLLGNNWIGYI